MAIKLRPCSRAPNSLSPTFITPLLSPSSSTTSWFPSPLKSGTSASSWTVPSYLPPPHPNHHLHRFLPLPELLQAPPSLTQSSTKVLFHSVLTSRIDYYNTILTRLPTKFINRLHLIQMPGACNIHPHQITHPQQSIWPSQPFFFNSTASRYISAPKAKTYFSPTKPSTNWLLPTSPNSCRRTASPLPNFPPQHRASAPWVLERSAAQLPDSGTQIKTPNPPFPPGVWLHAV